MKLLKDTERAARQLTMMSSTSLTLHGVAAISSTVGQTLG